MPPNDVWMSGKEMNYYYFGHFYIAVLTKLSNIESYYTFNLGLATIFSLMSVCVFEIMYNISKNFKYSSIAILIIVFMSNLIGLLHVITIAFPQTLNFFVDNFDLAYPLTCCTKGYTIKTLILDFPVWSSTRVIPNTINEFPYSDFLFRELHAHALSLPIQLLVIFLSLQILFSNRVFDDKKWMLLFILFSSIFVGSLFVTNSWDFPAYFILYSSSLLITENFLKQKKNIVVSILLLLILSILLYFPYYLNKSNSLSKGFVKERTNIFHFFILFPVFISVMYFYFIRDSFQYFLFTEIFSIVLAFIFNMPIIAITIPLIIFSIKKLTDKNNQKIDRFTFLLIILGSLISIYCDVFYIDSRYNNVFKFYYHIWMFFGMATCYLLYKMDVFRKDNKLVYVLLPLILSCFIMSVFSTFHKVVYGIENGISLDGLNYMKKYHPYDYEAIIWIRENLNEEDFIVEAPGRVYTWSSIVSSNTGVPTIIGWTQHEAHWRGYWPTERENDVNTIYTSSNFTKIMSLLRKYNAKYIYVGSVEKERYSDEVFEKFDGVFDIAFQNQGVKIYRVD
jgi:YYY domain-containing protein